MRKVALFGVLLLGLSVALMQDALAQTSHPTGGKINIGKLRIVPGLGLMEEYDDNIRLGNGTAAKPKVSDWITHVTPSLLLNYTLDGGRGMANAGYLGDYAFYKDNDATDWKRHMGVFNVDYLAPGGLIAGVDNVYIKTADPFGSESQYKLGRQTKRWNDLLQTKLGFRFSDRFRVLGYYNFSKQEYAEAADFTQNYDSNEFGGGAEVKVMPLTWAFLRYYYGQRSYNSHPLGSGVTENNDASFSWNRVSAGLTWDPEGKIKGELNLGYQWKNYDNTFSAIGTRFDNKQTWIAATKISYSATATTTLTLTFLRALRELGNDTSEYFEDTGGSIGIIQALDYRLNLLATAGYSKNDYTLPADKPKSQNNYIGTVGLEYKLLEWVAAVATYTYNRKDSNYVEDEYVDNRVLVGLRALY